MSARNEFETATNTVEASLVVEELSDADLMAINGGAVLTPVTAGLQKTLEGLGDVVYGVAGIVGSLA
ncbi:hypothetical protein HW132_04685 [Brasilonema sp. CT11]|nr:hypothetical protein [Brasilonema sp. CT11]